MKTRLPALLVVFMVMAPFADASWTLYVSATSTDNGDGTVTWYPTAGIVGNDGGWCHSSSLSGHETASLMINSYVWEESSAIATGYIDDGIDHWVSWPIGRTVPLGADVDFSVAAKVYGVCYKYPDEPEWPPFPLNTYYTLNWYNFIGPDLPPSPCGIDGIWTNCPLPWPAIWSVIYGNYYLRKNIVDTFMGQFFRRATSRYKKSISPPVCGQVICTYSVVPWCTPDTSADWIPLVSSVNGGTTLPPGLFGWDVSAECVRASNTARWSCAPITWESLELFGSPPQMACSTQWNRL